MSSLFQIGLKSIKTLDNGMDGRGKQVNLLSFSLVYPKEDVPSIETVKKYSLVNEEVHSLITEPYSEKLLFKTSFQGDSAIKVKLAVVESVSKIDKIMVEVIKGALLAGAGFITGGTGTTILLAGAKKVVESIFDSKELKDKITILGEIEFPLNENLEEGDLTLNLSVKNEIVIKRINKDNKETEIIRTIPKGLGIAQVILDIKRINRDDKVNTKEDYKIQV